MHSANNETTAADATRANRLLIAHSPVDDLQNAATAAHTAPMDNPKLVVKVSHGCTRAGKLLFPFIYPKA